MSESTSHVEPQTLKGFLDLLPEDIIPRRRVIDAIEAIFQRYGFVPIETPALEYLEVLLGTGGEETNKELFRLQSPEGEPIALRFDLTVPFSRILAQYPDRVKMPFRRYAIGPVWRADKPGPGRFRQFTQFDIDAAGAESTAVDAEVVAVMAEIMAALGAPSYAVLINNRKLIDALLDGCGIHEAARQKHVLRVIDKLQKVGLDNIRLELGPGRIDASGDPIPGVGLDTSTIDKIVDFIAINGGRRLEVVDNCAAVLPDSELTREALDEMREMAAALDALDVAEEHARFVPSLARGLDYYTGPVFEMVIPAAPEFGSLMGGGRYNQLVARFLDRAIPCTGMSVGLDRLMAALRHLQVLPEAKSTVQALIVTLGNVAPAEALKAAMELRRAGINAEAYFGAKRGMKHQLGHADRHGIPVAVILGEDEVAGGKVAIKDLEAGKKKREDIDDRDAYLKAGKTGQVTVDRGDMVGTVRELLG